MALEDVHIGTQRFDRFEPVLGRAQAALASERARQIRELLGSNSVWNVNSTAVGGGVAEMLPSLLAYTRGHGIDTRWVVIQGSPEFFKMTKRLHHALHGSAGDAAGLTAADRRIYEETTRHNATELVERLQRGDVVILHDPQTAGMAPLLLAAGARVIWRCHIGHDERNEHVDAAWAFLAPYLEQVPICVFSRYAYAPREIPADRVRVIAPSIDAFSPKNQVLAPDTVQAILAHTGLLEGPPPPGSTTLFTRFDGSPGRVERTADVVRAGRASCPDVPLIVQVSRWDPLKDMLGVMQGFAILAERVEGDKAELVLAGPNVHAVADDPEGPAVYQEVLDAWYQLPHAVRDRVHLAMLPTADIEENAAIVNALQRHATIVVQKSLHEGFGLTVTEAMWKGKPVVASRVGGIQDQVEHGRSGYLLDDPRDLQHFAELLGRLVSEPDTAAKMGERAQARVREQFLGIRHLLEYADIIGRLAG